MKIHFLLTCGDEDDSSRNLKIFQQDSIYLESYNVPCWLGRIRSYKVRGGAQEIHKLTYKIFYSYKRTLYTSTYCRNLAYFHTSIVGTAGILSFSVSLIPGRFSFIPVYHIV